MRRGEICCIYEFLSEVSNSMPRLEVQNRSIRGISAVLLPFLESGEIDWLSYENCLERTWNSGLSPAVNMDTGFANLISQQTRHSILERVSKQADGREFIAGAFVEDLSAPVEQRYLSEGGKIADAGGIPILFPSTALAALSKSERLSLFQSVGRHQAEFYGFELGTMFVPFGEIYDLDFFKELMQIPSLTGIKHSSLSRELEWKRLELRDEYRPDFKIYTGNDLAIDMVKWGSDYLLGLSAFYPEAFSKRDAFWESGDERFYELNDWLQYLGFLAFRKPVPAYKHNCAMFLKLRGLIQSDRQPAKGALRPESDQLLMQDILVKIDELME